MTRVLWERKGRRMRRRRKRRNGKEEGKKEGKKERKKEGKKEGKSWVVALTAGAILIVGGCAIDIVIFIA